MKNVDTLCGCPITHHTHTTHNTNNIKEVTTNNNNFNTCDSITGDTISSVPNGVATTKIATITNLAATEDYDWLCRLGEFW